MGFDNCVLPGRDSVVSVSHDRAVLIVQPNNDYDFLEKSLDTVEGAKYTTIVIGVRYLINTLLALTGTTPIDGSRAYDIGEVVVGVPVDGDGCLRLQVRDKTGYIAQRKVE